MLNRHRQGCYDNILKLWRPRQKQYRGIPHHDTDFCYIYFSQAVVLLSCTFASYKLQPAELLWESLSLNPPSLSVNVIFCIIPEHVFLLSLLGSTCLMMTVTNVRRMELKFSNMWWLPRLTTTQTLGCGPSVAGSTSQSSSSMSYSFLQHCSEHAWGLDHVDDVSTVLESALTAQNEILEWLGKHNLKSSGQISF